jgi:hypothetical protein
VRVTISASQLRADVYNLLDQALATGEVIEVERRGQRLRIVPPRRTSWLDRLPRREGVVVGDPAALVEVEALFEWDGE